MTKCCRLLSYKQASWDEEKSRRIRYLNQFSSNKCFACSCRQYYNCIAVFYHSFTINYSRNRPPSVTDIRDETRSLLQVSPAFPRSSDCLGSYTVTGTDGDCPTKASFESLSLSISHWQLQ